MNNRKPYFTQWTFITFQYPLHDATRKNQIQGSQVLYLACTGPKDKKVTQSQSVVELFQTYVFNLILMKLLLS